MTLAVVLAMRDQWAEAFDAAKLALADELIAKHMQPDIAVFFFGAAATGHVAEAIAVLSASPAAAKLEPLLVALQILNGQTPNAPYEVLEVAKDIVKQIETIRGSARPAVGSTASKSASKKTNKKSPERVRGRR